MRRLNRLILATSLALAPTAAVAQGLLVDAGPDVVLECTADDGTEHTLMGTVVPTGPNLTVSWSSTPEVDLTDDDTLTPTGRFPLGDTVVTLDAEDPDAALSGSDDVMVTVEDTQAPIVQAQADPSVLWPPNHELQTVRVRIRARDNCSSADDMTIELLSVESNEPDNGQGDGNTVNDIQDADIGSDDRQLLLRAERSGRGDGRVYTLRYLVTDGAGAETMTETKVHVPHNFSDVKDRIRDDMDDDRDEMDNICPRPDDAADEFIDALPQLGSFPNRDVCLSACRTWDRGCMGIVRGSSRCVYAEEKALKRLDVRDCASHDGRKERRGCSRLERSELRVSIKELRAQASDAKDTCESVGRRCANACRTLFDPNGDIFDDEGMDE